MPDARININIGGQSQLNQALTDAERQGQRVRANTAATLQNTLDVVRASSGLQLDPARSRADMGALRQHQQQQQRTVRELNADAPARREQLAGRRAGLEQRLQNQEEKRAEEYLKRKAWVQENYDKHQDRIASRGAEMEAAYQAKGGQGTPRVVEKWMATQQGKLDEWRDGHLGKIEGAREEEQGKPSLTRKALEQSVREQEDYERTLQGANEGLVEFAEHIRAFADLAGRIERGEVEPGEAVPSTRQLGHLEKLRLEEDVLKARLGRASESDLPEARKALQAKQKEIDKAEGGTSRDAGQRQLADSIGNSVQRALLGVGGAMGGAIGQTLGAGIQVAGATREIATVDPAKIAGATIAAAAIATASLASLTLPRGKELEGSTNRLAGVAGTGTNNRTFGTGVQYQAGGAGGAGDARSVVESLAMSLSEFRDYARSIALSSGSARGLENRATAQLTYERAFGMDAGAMSSIGSESYRLKGSMEGNIAQMLSIFQNSGLINVRDKGLFDTTRLAESFQRAQSLTDMQKDRFAKADPARSARLVAAGEAVGGMFSGSTGNGKLQQLDKAIANPGNEYAQAATFRALAQPGDDLYDVQKRQEAGIFDGGENYKRIYNFLLKKNGGQNDKRFRMDLSAYTGFDLRTTEQLAQAGAGAMQGVGSDKDFAAKYGSAAFQGRAIDQTGDLQKLDTMLVNKLQILGLDGKDALVGMAKLAGLDLRPAGQVQAENRQVLKTNADIVEHEGTAGQKDMQRTMNKNLADIAHTLANRKLQVHVTNHPAPPATTNTTRSRPRN